MKTQLLLILLIIGSCNFLFGQEIAITKNGVKEEIYFDKSEACNKELVFMVVEQIPTYRGGMKQLEADLKEVLSFDKSIKKEFVLRSTVNCNGEIFGFQADENQESNEVERLKIELLKLQNWEAAEQNGNQVDCFYTISGKIKRGKIKIYR